MFRPYSIRKWSLRRRQIPVLMPSICHKTWTFWLWHTKNKITLQSETTHYFARVRFAFLYFIIDAAIEQITNIQTNTSTLFLQLWRSTLYWYLLDNWNDKNQFLFLNEDIKYTIRPYAERRLIITKFALGSVGWFHP